MHIAKKNELAPVMDVIGNGHAMMNVSVAHLLIYICDGATYINLFSAVMPRFV